MGCRCIGINALTECLTRIATSVLNFIEYPPILELKDRLLIFYPTKEDYELALKIMIKLRKVGKPVNVVDVILASIAINRGLVVVTDDKDFEQIGAVEERLRVQHFVRFDE